MALLGVKRLMWSVKVATLTTCEATVLNLSMEAVVLTESSEVFNSQEWFAVFTDTSNMSLSTLSLRFVPEPTKGEGKPLVSRVYKHKEQIQSRNILTHQIIWIVAL